MLVVTNNDRIISKFERLLSDKYQVVVVRTKDDALERIADLDENVSLVLIALRDDEELTNQLNDQFPKIPIVIVAKDPEEAREIESRKTENVQMVIIRKAKPDHILRVIENSFSTEEDAAGMGDEDSDAAMLGDEVGGIDFNANNLNMKIQGDEIKFDIPADLQHIQPNLIDGLTPVIINIVPITNFPLLLGVSVKEEEGQQLSKLQ